MSDAIIVGLLALAGTAIGALAGIAASSQLTNFRLKQLEAKVDKHNNLIERVYKLEGRLNACEERGAK